MNDDDTRDRDERDELLAAYLDGDATAEERARVEADPALGAEVERLRRLAATLRDPEPPRAAARESAIAAALAVFDAEQAGSAGQAGSIAHTMPPDVVTLDRRRGRSRWSAGLGVAAAALAVVGVGVIVSQRQAEAPVADGNAALVSVADLAATATTAATASITDATTFDLGDAAETASEPSAAAATGRAIDSEPAAPTMTAARPGGTPPAAAPPAAAPTPEPDPEDAPVVLGAAPAGDAMLADDGAFAQSEAAADPTGAMSDAELARHSGEASPVRIRPGDDLDALVDDRLLFPGGVGELADVDRLCRAAAGLTPRAPGATIPLMTLPPGTAATTTAPATGASSTGSSSTGAPPSGPPTPGGLVTAVYATAGGETVDVYLALDDGTPVLLHATECALLEIDPTAR